MNPIQPEELSALIDGELDPQREREIRTELAVNAQLRTELDTLRRLDASVRAAAEKAAFDPSITFAPRSEFPWASMFALVGMLLFIRFAVKFLDTQALIWLSNIAALVATLAVTMRLRLGADVDALARDRKPDGSRF